jgi:outer membrane protein
MKKRSKMLLSLGSLVCAAALLMAAAPGSPSGDAEAKSKSQNAASPAKDLKVCVVNFKQCVEKSKMGKQEQANFEALKKQMESVLEEKEKTLNEMATKFNDADYLDSLSPEAETDLKRKFRALNQELTQMQSQYMQTLNQTNFKVVQKLNENVAKSAEEIAKKENYDLVLNEEAIYFYKPTLDITSKVVAFLDEIFDKEAKENKDKK